ncbi:MAG: tRNA 2-thiouridine(34) synthase MnmA [Phycisphaerales bacterium]|nr:tRNA 2-thiouridine(34) synthase MnmA [Phycisphaerales bacterium]
MSMKKVLIAISGGVDSAVAAALLKHQGYACTAIHMQLHPSCSPTAATDAKQSADLLNIPFQTLDFRQDFQKIIDYFIQEYNAGRTPNPCIRCNTQLKFGKLAQYAHSINADYLATGHYARIENVGGESQLFRAVDLTKDQSYALFAIPRHELSRILLPLGSLKKEEIRTIAKSLNLPIFNKPDSQDICFIPNNDYTTLLRTTPGQFIDTTGKPLGTHPGHQHFTIGQRKGLRIALGHPTYVTNIDPKTNQVTLGQKQNLLHNQLIAHEVNWLLEKIPTTPLRVRAKVRYNSPPTPATATITAPDELTVTFDASISAITPGQAVVCYHPTTDQLLTGAWIDNVIT